MCYCWWYDKERVPESDYPDYQRLFPQKQTWWLDRYLPSRPLHRYNHGIWRQREEESTCNKASRSSLRKLVYASLRTNLTAYKVNTLKRTKYRQKSCSFLNHFGQLRGKVRLRGRGREQTNDVMTRAKGFNNSLILVRLEALKYNLRMNE